MKLWRLVLAGFLAISFMSTPLSGAYAQTSAPQDDVQIPAGYEAMFEEIGRTMAKFPGAAARFSIRDRQATPIPIKPRAGSFHACCERHCSGSSCTCSEWCKE